MKKSIITIVFLSLALFVFANRDSTGVGLSYERWANNPYFSKVNSTNVGFGKRLTFPGATITENGDSINVDLNGVFWKLGGQALAANANIGSTSAHRFGITTNGVPRVYYSSDGRVYSGTVTDWVFSSSDTSSSKGAVAIFGTTGANSAQLVAGDTVRVKLSSTTLEMENNRTGNQTVFLADRTTAPAVGGYSTIGISLANTVTTALRSYHEVNGTAYSTGLHTLSSGITNTTPAWYATHLNKFAINRDTATWCLDVKGSGTDALLARFEANDENAFMALQNSNTGNTSSDGFHASITNLDAAINNRENGGITFSTNNTPAFSVNADQTIDLSAYDGARDANIQVTPTGRIERVEYAIGEIYVDDADPDTITFAGGSTTADSLDDVTLGDTINFQKVGSSLKYIGTDTALFMLNANLSFSFGEAVIIHAAVFKNQVEDTSIGFERKIGVGGDIGEGGCSGIIKLFPNDRVIVLFFPDAHTGDDNLIVDKYNISLHKLAKL